MDDERRRGVVAPAVLDQLRAHPFYAAYKARTFEMLRAVDGGRYLDVGAGTGADGRSAAGAWIALDHTVAMASTAGGVAGDVLALPFGDALFDGCRADRVLQYVADAAAAVREMARVVRPGGWVVVADPDYDTQVVEVDDQSLARRVRDYRRDGQRANGAFAHQAVGAFVRAGLVDIEVEGRVLVVREPRDVDNVMGLRGWPRLGGFPDAAAWEADLDRAAAEGRFLYAVTFFLTAARKT